MPQHVDTGRQLLNYLCEKRKKDYDDIMAYYDPDGTVMKKFQEKYGGYNCVK